MISTCTVTSRLAQQAGCMVYRSREDLHNGGTQDNPGINYRTMEELFRWEDALRRLLT